MIDRLKNKITDYLKNESKWSIASNVFITILLVLLLIPSTRIEILPRIQRLVLMSPSVNEESEQVELTDNDFAYQIEDAQGQTTSLSEFKGEVIFLNVWATWCPPCIAEMPSIQKLYNDYKGKVKFVFLTNEGQDKVAPFMQKRGFNLPVYKLKYQLPDKLFTESIPSTFVITKNGKIAISKVGTADWNSSQLRETIDKLLAE